MGSNVCGLSNDACKCQMNFCQMLNGPFVTRTGWPTTYLTDLAKQVGFILPMEYRLPSPHVMSYWANTLAGSSPCRKSHTRTGWPTTYLTDLAKQVGFILPMEYRLPSPHVMSYWANTLAVQALAERATEVDKWRQPAATHCMKPNF